MTEQTTASGLNSEAGMGAKAHEADLIGAQELKEKLDRGDDFKLVMVRTRSLARSSSRPAFLTKGGVPCSKDR